MFPRCWTGRRVWRGAESKVGFRQQLNKSANWMWKGQASYHETHCKGQVRYTEVSLGGTGSTCDQFHHWDSEFPPFSVYLRGLTSLKTPLNFSCVLIQTEIPTTTQQTDFFNIKKCFYQQPWLIISRRCWKILWSVGEKVSPQEQKIDYIILVNCILDFVVIKMCRHHLSEPLLKQLLQTISVAPTVNSWYLSFIKLL